jgi:methionine synthase I (cobalamin-dependent)
MQRKHLTPLKDLRAASTTPAISTVDRAWKAFLSVQLRYEAGELIVLDGATGTELTKSVDVNAEQQWNGWPAQCFVPEAVEAVHRSYVKAGSDVVTANTYGTNRHVMGIKAYDTTRAAVADANTKGVAIARRAANDENSTGGRTVLVAGSMSNHPPAIAACGLVLDDDFFDSCCSQDYSPVESSESESSAVSSATSTASESTASEVSTASSDSSPPCVEKKGLLKLGPFASPPTARAQNPTDLGAWPERSRELENYREQARWLAHSGCDVLFLEMIKDGVHGDLLVQAAVEVGLPVIVGMTLGVDSLGRVVMRDDPNLLVSEMIDYWGSHPNVVGFSAMHCSVRDTETFVKAIRHHWKNGFVGAYPNQGLWIPPEWKVERSLTPEEYADFARKWHMAGANAIGGCCGIGPEHISAVKEVADEVLLDLKRLEAKGPTAKHITSIREIK